MRCSVRMLAGVLLFTASACSCDEEPLSVVDAGTDAGFLPPDAGLPIDAGVPPIPDAGPEQRTITFDGTSPITVYHNAVSDLRFLLRSASGSPVPSDTIRFSSSGSGGSLNVTSALTDVNGAATVRFTAGPIDGQMSVTAEADNASSTTIQILIRTDPNAGVTVDLSSGSRIPSVTGEALVYIGPAGSIPSCATLATSATLPAASFALQYSALPGSQTRMGQMSGSSVTVYATGWSAQAREISHACSDGNILAGGTNTRISLVLSQDPTVFAGDYDALLYFDLGAALPSPYDETVGLITDILSDPAGWTVYQTLKQSDQQIGTSFVTWTPPMETMQRLATFDEVSSNPNIFNTWRTASDLLDNFLASQLGQTYVDVTTAGMDIAHVVREFEVGSHYTVTSTLGGPRMDIVEDWQALVFTWQLNCPPGDFACARRPIALSDANANLAPAQSIYTATITHAPLSTPAPGETERYKIEPDQHAINIRYGAIILLALNEVVFPNLPPSIAGNNLTEVLGNIVQCADVAASLSMSTGFPMAALQTLCDTGVAAAAAYAENQLLMLDSVDNPDLVGRTEAGLTGGGEMYFVDADHDLRTELINDIMVYAQWTDPNDPMLSQDITSPITGSGRRSASDCSTSADCAADRICIPIPSYLQVAEIEKDCRYPIGTFAGGAACTLDADCQSGLCFDPGSGSRICYTACEGAGSCLSGTCTTDAAAVNLDGVINGLGDVTTDACVP